MIHKKDIENFMEEQYVLYRSEPGRVDNSRKKLFVGMNQKTKVNYLINNKIVTSVTFPQDIEEAIRWYNSL